MINLFEIYTMKEKIIVDNFIKSFREKERFNSLNVIFRCSFDEIEIFHNYIYSTFRFYFPNITIDCDLDFNFTFSSDRDFLSNVITVTYGRRIIDTNHYWTTSFSPSFESISYNSEIFISISYDESKFYHGIKTVMINSDTIKYFIPRGMII